MDVKNFQPERKLYVIYTRFFYIEEWRCNHVTNIFFFYFKKKEDTEKFADVKSLNIRSRFHALSEI